jgi:hypothetical protein
MSAPGDISFSDLNLTSSDGNSGVVKVSSSAGKIYTDGGIFAFSGGSGNGGSITLSAINDITISGYVGSGAFAGKGGNINVTSSSGNIEAGENTFAANSTSGSGGNIRLKANAITSGSIDSGANGDGNGGIIKLETLNDIKTGTIVSNSNGAGESGNITLISTNGGIDTTGNSLATAAKVIFAGANLGKAGNITFKAKSDITSSSLFTPSNAGAGSNIDITSTDGGINIQGNATSTSGTNTAGSIKLTALKDIVVEAVNSRVEGNGLNGGQISLKSTSGSITAKWLRSDSTQGTGGNIKIDAAKLVKVTDSENIGGFDYSIYASGNAGNNSATIKHGGRPFIVGDAAINGTKGAISTATSWIFPISHPFSFLGSYTTGNVRIINVGGVLDTNPYPGDPTYLTDPALPGNSDPDDNGASKNKQLRTYTEQELNEVEQRYRNAVRQIRQDGHLDAADNLERFLNGVGGTKTYTRDYLRTFGVVSSTEDRLRDYFTGRTFYSQLSKNVRNLQDGQAHSIQFTDTWEAKVAANPLLDLELYFAVGATLLTATGDFTLIIPSSGQGSRVIISGVIRYRWHDTYDWNEGDSVWTPYGVFKDDDALALDRQRGAEPFEVIANWTQTMSAQLITPTGLVPFWSTEFNDVN